MLNLILLAQMAVVAGSLSDVATLPNGVTVQHDRPDQAQSDEHITAPAAIYFNAFNESPATAPMPLTVPHQAQSAKPFQAKPQLSQTHTGRMPASPPSATSDAITDRERMPPPPPRPRPPPTNTSQPFQAQLPPAASNLFPFGRSRHTASSDIDPYTHGYAEQAKIYGQTRSISCMQGHLDGQVQYATQYLQGQLDALHMYQQVKDKQMKHNNNPSCDGEPLSTGGAPFRAVYICMHHVHANTCHWL